MQRSSRSMTAVNSALTIHADAAVNAPQTVVSSSPRETFGRRIAAISGRKLHNGRSCTLADNPFFAFQAPVCDFEAPLYGSQRAGSAPENSTAPAATSSGPEGANVWQPT
jgi:hypothetical protein